MSRLSHSVDVPGSPAMESISSSDTLLPGDMSSSQQDISMILQSVTDNQEDLTKLEQLLKTVDMTELSKHINNLRADRRDNDKGNDSSHQTSSQGSPAAQKSAPAVTDTPRKRYQAYVEDCPNSPAPSIQAPSSDVIWTDSSDQEKRPIVTRARPNRRRASSPAASDTSSWSLTSATSSNKRDATTPRPANLLTPPVSPKAQQQNVRFATRPPPVILHRPQPPPRSFSDYGKVVTPSRMDHRPSQSPTDQAWGTLFTGDDEPTERLMAVLRSLAHHLNAFTPPQNTIVLTPAKLQAFYRDYRADRERLNFQFILECASSEAEKDLAYVYRRLGCEFHLVQNKVGERPTIPALTPAGFARWSSVLIQSFPEVEFERMYRVVRDVQLYTEAGRPGEALHPLPRQLSRHLFPSRPNKALNGLLSEKINNAFPRKGIEPLLPTLTIPTSSGRSNMGSGAGERRRKDSDRYRSDRGADIEVSRNRSRARSRGPPSTGYLRSERSRSRYRASERDETSNLSPESPTGSRMQRVPSGRRTHRASIPAVGNDDVTYLTTSPMTPTRRASAAATYFGSTTSEPRYSREDTYRLYQGRDMHSSGGDAVPRIAADAGGAGLGSQRRTLAAMAVSSPSQDYGGPTYEEYLRGRSGSN